MTFIRLKIQKVLQLEGVQDHFVEAYVSEADKEGIQYAVLSFLPQDGIMDLGEIDPKTKMFEYYDPEKNIFGFYTREANYVINKIFVPEEQFARLKTLEEILTLPGISVRKESVPKKDI